MHLALRHKFFVSLASYVASILVVGYLSYTDLKTVQRHVLLIEEMQLIANDILEARRFEKNFLLYSRVEDLKEGMAFLAKVEGLIAVLRREDIEPVQRSLLQAVDENAAGYRDALRQIIDGPGGAPQDSDNAERLRLHGKTMVESSEAMLANETARIRATIKELIVQLAISVAVALALGVFAALVMFGKIYNALRIIQTATRRVAQGVFEPLPELPGQEEAQGVVRALNAMVKELELRQDQLVQAKKLSSIGTLAAGIAHQLNNPLNNISTSSQIALEELQECPPEFLRKMLGNVVSESQRAKEIVQGLLEFSREKSFTRGTVQLRDVVEKTIRLFSSQAPATITITAEVPEGVLVDVDAQRIQEALLNLIINAVQAIEPAAGSIVIQAKARDGEAELLVKDSGRGIPPEVVEKIFDPFFTTRGDGGGTGLGLSIVHGIVQRHKGRIHVESAPGAGTTFHVHLPLAEQGGAP